MTITAELLYRLTRNRGSVSTGNLLSLKTTSIRLSSGLKQVNSKLLHAGTSIRGGEIITGGTGGKVGTE